VPGQSDSGPAASLEEDIEESPSKPDAVVVWEADGGVTVGAARRKRRVPAEVDKSLGGTIAALLGLAAVLETPEEDAGTTLTLFGASLRGDCKAYSISARAGIAVGVAGATPGTAGDA